MQNFESAPECCLKSLSYCRSKENKILLTYDIKAVFFNRVPMNLRVPRVAAKDFSET